MIKKNWVYFLFAFSVILFVVTRFTRCNSHKGMKYITSKTIHSDSLGWGYEILANDTVLIHQVFIPAVQGKKGFVSEDQAKTIAHLLIKKMSTSKDLPQITIQELDSCGITR
jgi:hypothetical protein